MPVKALVAILLSLSLSMTPATALVVDVTSGDWQPINIFIDSFANEEKLPGNPPSAVVANDLTVSGQFRVHRRPATNRQTDVSERLDDLRSRGGEYLLTGKIDSGNDGNKELTFTLYDTLTGDSIGAYALFFTASNQRLAAHNVSNWIYEQIVGRRGVFHTKVAYVLRHDGKNELKIADYDGHNRQTILSSDTTIISPAWTPDGNSLLYVSFERNKPVIYAQSLLTGKRQIIANFKGSNSAPSMSPDRRQIAVSLTEHGGEQQIYLLQDNSRSRLRVSDGINTEPVFSPDGDRLAFTSDESGSPQIYEQDLRDSDSRRLTYDGRYNASPSYSSDGDSIVFIHRNRRGDNVAVLDMSSGKSAILTTDCLANCRADSPTFSPNDDFVLFVDENKKKYLATVSINGKVTVFWEDSEEGEIIDPTWSPFQSKWF